MHLPDFTLHLGDCLKSLRAMPDNSIDSIVTDPPYGLAFMGKRWDYDVPSVEIWAECLRVLKPGGHLLAFAGTRTQHRMAVRIEDGGFEIRDMIAWTYGVGFPKSRDVSEAMRKHIAGDRAIPVESSKIQVSEKPIDRKKNGARVRKFLDGVSGNLGITQSWGTALKPALEPITLARKRPIGTVTNNVRSVGAGALNIDACRIGTPNRWPANFIHDGSEEVLLQLGDAARFFYCGKASKRDRDEHVASHGHANKHITVKPTDLMAYLVRLVTPPGGLVLDPFMGSGSTGKAAMREGFNFIGCELSPEYLAIAEARIAHELAKRQRPEPPPEP